MRSLKQRKNKKAVVWVSTIVYTLIGLSIIALLLAVVNPKIKEMKDSFAIKQTIVALGDFDDIIPDIKKAIGNKRLYELYLSKGNFKVDCANEIVEWNLKDSNAMASEPDGQPWPSGNVNIITDKVSEKIYSVTLEIDYSHLDLKCGDDRTDTEIVLQPASTPYKIYVENEGSFISVVLS